jgi:transposase
MRSLPCWLSSFPSSPRCLLIPAAPRPWPYFKAIEAAYAFVEAGVESITRQLHDLTPHQYGRQTAEQLVALARRTVSSGRAKPARATSLKIRCDQLTHTQQNLALLEQEIDALIAQDPGVQGLQGVQEFGPKTMAVLRAELTRRRALRWL